MWRAVHSPLLHTSSTRHHRLGISHYTSMLVGWRSVAEIVSCGQGTIRRRAGRCRDCADDQPADVVGGIPPSWGEWFLMWQSKMWNRQEEAFRMFTIVGIVFLVVVQREPTPD